MTTKKKPTAPGKLEHKLARAELALAAERVRGAKLEHQAARERLGALRASAPNAPARSLRRTH